MKKVFAVLIVLLTALIFQAFAADNLIVPSQRVGWFTIGMNMFDVSKALGRAGGVSNLGGGIMQVSYLAKYGIILNVQGDNVVSINTSNAAYYTKEGIKVGSSEESVMKAFGRNFKINQDRPEAYQINYLKKGIAFLIKNKKVIMISVYKS
ncbi:MAG: hypothetical protein M1536_04910 [Firmicutes bacterium]|nr:hypothetical protein [Bacillota bacterium]